MSGWYTICCEDCGDEIRAHEDWDNPPKVCKPCKEKRAAQWYEKPCDNCGLSIRANRNWERPPAYCKSCLDQFAPRDVSCRQCGKSITLSTAVQLKCAKNGWDLPSRCKECKHDALLIKGAIGALRDQFPFALEVEIEQRGLIFTDKVAVVRRRRDGNKVAEVRIDEKGLIFTKRVAVATDINTGKVISETRDETRGLIFTERFARTYAKPSGKRTHETTNEERGIVFPKKYARTENVDTKQVVDTTTEKRGFFFTRWIMRAGKKK